MKIITDIKIYNFHLIISFLNGEIKIIRIQDIRNFISDTNLLYRNKLNVFGNLQEMTAKRHVLYGVKENQLVSNQLLITPESYSKKPLIEDRSISQISIDFLKDNLYAMSSEKGIVEWNIRNPNTPKKLKEIVPKSFEKLGDPVLSNLISKDNIVLFSIRGYGINKIFNENEIESTQLDLKTSDPQDTNFIEKLKIVIIADAFDGLIIYDETQKEIAKKIKLPENDFPQQIELLLGNILVKGKFGLYILHLNNMYLERIWEGKTGVISKYYGLIFFTTNGKLVIFQSGTKQVRKKISFNELTEIERLEF